MELSLLVPISILIVYFIYVKVSKIIKRRKEEKSDRNKRESIVDSIKSEILGENIGESFYPSLEKSTERFLESVNNSKDKESIKLVTTNNYYCQLKRNIRIFKEYKRFHSKFTYIKRKYRMTFNKSVEVLHMLEEKYGKSVVDKYLTKFDRDYSNIKNDEVNDLNKLVKKTRTLFDNFEAKSLDINLKEIKKIDCDLVIKLEEPIRLRDKFLKCEDNISQLETEIKNKKGSLYQRVFNIIKHNNVTREDTDEWNRIKKVINSFNKSYALGGDVIELSVKLNKIISDLTDLDEDLRDKFKTGVNVSSLDS